MPTLPEKDRQTRRDAARFDRWVWFLHLLAALVLGASFFPAVYGLVSVWKALAGHALWVRVLALSFSLAFAYFIFGATLITLCVLTKNLLGFRIAPGLFKIHSRESLHWMGYNSLILLANAAFLDVLRISPFQLLFYRWMGARIGKGVNINTAGLADLSMLEIGDKVLIGGGVALICHASERGFIRLEPTRIGNGVSVGLGSVILPGCQIGDGATIAPCSFLPRGTRVPARGYWGGNPVRDLRAERRAALSKEDPGGPVSEVGNQPLS